MYLILLGTLPNAHPYFSSTAVAECQVEADLMCVLIRTMLPERIRPQSVGPLVIVVGGCSMRNSVRQHSLWEVVYRVAVNARGDEYPWFPSALH